jgi:hypothetical protein
MSANGLQLAAVSNGPRVMEFKSAPQLLPGLNFTLRYGPKWSGVDPGTTLVLKQTGQEKVLQTATVMWSEVVAWEKLPEVWLPFNQAPGARTREGLEKAMDAAYGMQWRDAASQGVSLVAVFFWANPTGVL